MKPQSEIGEGLAAGHACYFVGFLPRPVQGQTIEDVCRAEAAFVADVTARHPSAESKPILKPLRRRGFRTQAEPS
jgi:hypothetical protein